MVGSMTKVPTDKFAYSTVTAVVIANMILLVDHADSLIRTLANTNTKSQSQEITPLDKTPYHSLNTTSTLNKGYEVLPPIEVQLLDVTIKHKVTIACYRETHSIPRFVHTYSTVI